MVWVLHFAISAGGTRVVLVGLAADVRGAGYAYGAIDEVGLRI